jgi:hypothetical protein
LRPDEREVVVVFDDGTVGPLPGCRGTPGARGSRRDRTDCEARRTVIAALARHNVRPLALFLFVVWVVLLTRRPRRSVNDELRKSLKRSSPAP